MSVQEGDWPVIFFMLPLSGFVSKVIPAYERHWGISPLFLYVGKVCVCAEPLQLCLTLCGPVDCTLPVSSIHGILQALEWVTISSSRATLTCKLQLAPCWRQRRENRNKTGSPRRTRLRELRGKPACKHWAHILHILRAAARAAWNWGGAGRLQAGFPSHTRARANGLRRPPSPQCPSPGNNTNSLSLHYNV